MLHALAELVGAILHGVGSTPGRPDARSQRSGPRRSDVVVAIVMLIVLALCVAGVVAGLVLAVANG